ncbi:MAG: TolB family protein, partial [Candidatus Methylumidiphilus sp.]
MNTLTTESSDSSSLDVAASAIQPQIVRVSTDSAGVQGNSDSRSAAISADGRYVAFDSHARNLVAGDTYGYQNVFVKDLQTGVTTRVSTNSAGAQANNDSASPAISADGRYVAFWSIATDQVAADTNGTSDIFVKDLQTGATTRVSTDSAGVQGNGFSFAKHDLSADGRYVAFYSEASNLVAGDTNGILDVFVKDLQTGATTRVSTDSAGAQANYYSYSPVLSADGRYVAFFSGASNLAVGDTELDTTDVFVKDMQTGVTAWVSTYSTGGFHGYSPAISADGRLVAFPSTASKLVVGDTNGYSDIFIKDLQMGTTTRASTDNAGAQANENSFYDTTLSADGRFVAFTSYASNLVAGDTNGAADIFVKDLQTGATALVSASSAG